MRYSAVWFTLWWVVTGLVCAAAAAVSLRDTTLTWPVYQHTIEDNYTISDFSSDPSRIQTRSFSAKALENEYLRVILLPEFGGRILSIVYKPTGREQLYQNPVGLPYNVGRSTFYYEWLMIYGGIFPTMTEPEHGKTWCIPWEYTVLRQSEDTVAIRMAQRDTIDFVTSSRWKYGKTGIQCDFDVTLTAGATALRTDITLTNESSQPVSYEYWTNAALAPGSDIGAARCDRHAELVLPVARVKIPAIWDGIASREQKVSGKSDIYHFDKLRHFKHWSDWGILYAWDTQTPPVWGAIHHGVREGIFRISDNIETPGVKVWTFGYEKSVAIDPFVTADPHRPFLEMWAGVSREFFTPATLAANAAKSWSAWYTPAVGLPGISLATEHILLHAETDKARYDAAVDTMTVSVDFFATRPDSPVRLRLVAAAAASAAPLAEETVIASADEGNSLRMRAPAHTLCRDIAALRLQALSETGVVLGAMDLPIAIDNRDSCQDHTAVVPRGEATVKRRGDHAPATYTIGGRKIAPARMRPGVYIHTTPGSDRHGIQVKLWKRPE